MSLWTRDVPFTPDMERTLDRRRRARQRSAPNKLQRRKQKEIDRLLAEGTERIGRLSEREFLVTGAALYAGEGSKRDGAVALANTDPRFIAFFCAWLRHFFDIDESRLRVALYLHQGLDLDAAIGYWAGTHRHPARPVRRVVSCGSRHGHPPLQACARRRRARALLLHPDPSRCHGLVHALLAGPGRVQWETPTLNAILQERLPG